ncbi:MAG: peptidylprolyl isomerase [Arenicella sp.]
MPRLACASHILVKTEREAKSLIQQLKNGANFAVLAKKNSLCPSKKKGGDLGEFAKGTMVKPFDQVVFAKGSEDKPFLGPVKTRFGFHVIQVLYKS